MRAHNLGLLLAILVPNFPLFSYGQTLAFDSSITGYQIATSSNSIAIAGEVDAFAFDALAGDVDHHRRRRD